MSTHHIRLAHLQQVPLRAQPSRIGLWATLRAMHAAWRTRRLLAVMDDRTLADIGIGRGDAMVEAARPIWDVAPLKR